MKRTYKFKAKINKETEANANHWLSLCKNIYNACLEQRRFLYSQRKESLSGYDQANQLKELKTEFPEYKSVGSQVLQDVTERVNKAYRLFYSNLKANNGLAGLPRFKSHHRYKSFTLKQAGWRLDGRYLTVTNVGVFKLFKSQEILGDIKTVTIKRDSCGDWFVFFSCDNVPLPEYKSFEEDAIGLDVGINSFVTDSNGNKIENPKHFRNAERKLRTKQRKLSRRKKGSNNRNKSRKQVAKQHRKVARQRRDFLFKTAKGFIDKYALIAVEKLNVRNMVKNRKLAKSISDAGWGEFRQILKYKAEEAGRLVVEVNPKNTSQKCSNCGSKPVIPISLGVREYNCSCGLQLGRDHNAALNILQSAVGQTVCALT